MFLSKLSIKRPVMTSMGLLVFLLFGVLAYFDLPLNLLPEVNIPYVTVRTIYPGAGPKEVEILVSNKIEEAVSTLGKIKVVRAFSMENISYVMLEFKLGKDVNIAAQEVRDKVGAIIGNLPGSVETPVIEKLDVGARPVISLVLTGTMEKHKLFDLADNQLKDKISQIEGVGSVDIVGKQQREITIEFDNRTVFQNRISLPQLSQLLSAYNMDLPAGNFQERSQEYGIRTKGTFPTIADIRNFEIPTPFGRKKIGELGSVIDTATKIRERTTYFDVSIGERMENAILLNIIKSSDGNVMQMAKTLKSQLPVLEKGLPSGTRLFIANDESINIESSVKDTLSNIILGVVLTGLVLLFFLHDLRSTLIVAVSMPFSIISTFFLMQLFGFSMNMMSLMGLSTAVGVLVSNSIVVLESIFHYRSIGLERSEAADRGTGETALAVIASTMTNIVVFLPIASMSSLVGQFFKEFALTVSFATMFSIVASFTITPMLASIILPKHIGKPGKISRVLDSLFSRLEWIYRKSLEFILKAKVVSLLVLVAAFALFAGVMVEVAPKVGFGFFPTMDEGNILIEIELPEGNNLDETAGLLRLVEEKVTRHKEVQRVLTTLGKIGNLDVGTNLAIAEIKLVDKKMRSISSAQMVSKLIEDLGTVPNAVIRIAATSSDGAGAPVTFYLKGQEMEKLDSYKTEIIAAITDVPGLINLNTSSKSGKPEITMIPDRRMITDAGLTVMDLALTLQSSVEGLVATKYKESGKEYDIRIKLTDISVNAQDKIGNISVVAPNGVYKLSQLADIQISDGYSKILHVDKAKTIEFTGYTADGYPLGDVVGEINKRLDQFELETGYQVDWGGSSEMMQETMVDMLRTFLIAIVLTYMLLAAILESLTQPLMILITVPLAFIGIFPALLMTGTEMNIIAMMAVIMLLGIVVNNAILMLDYANTLRRQGKGVKDALIEACPSKLKPILMSTIAIALGMLPMALGIGDAGTEFRQPMGIVSIAGLSASAIMTLFVIPSIYSLFSRDKIVAN